MSLDKDGVARGTGVAGELRSERPKEGARRGEDALMQRSTNALVHSSGGRRGAIVISLIAVTVAVVGGGASSARRGSRAREPVQVFLCYPQASLIQ